MLDDAAFEREKRAYELIRDDIERMLESGYEVRFFDNPPRAEIEMLLVGPASPGERPDVRKLRIPYTLAVLLARGDAEAERELQWHAGRVTEASKDLLSFLTELIGKRVGRTTR